MVRANIPEFKPRHMSAVVEAIQPPVNIFRALLWPNSKTQAFEEIQWDRIIGHRDAAPYTSREGRFRKIDDYTSASSAVSPLTIKLQSDMTLAERVYTRFPGHRIYDPDFRAAVREGLAYRLRRMRDLETNAIELQAAKVTLERKFSVRDPDYANVDVDYTDDWPAVFTVDYSGGADPNRWATNNTDKQCEERFLEASRIGSQWGVMYTDCIMGRNAGYQYRQYMKGQPGLMDYKRVSGGQLEAFNNKYGEDGKLLVGTLHGYRIWEVSKTIGVKTGPGETYTETDLVHPDYIYFVAAGPANKNMIYYGSIPDWRAWQNNQFQTRRFVRSYLPEEAMSPRVIQMVTRPVCVPQMPEQTLRMKVL